MSEDVSTVRDIEEKLKHLEMELLGRESAPVNSPFTPVSAFKKRLEELKKFAADSEQSSSSMPPNGISTKLPSIPLPMFDGVEHEFFLKEFFGS